MSVCHQHHNQLPKDLPPQCHRQPPAWLGGPHSRLSGAQVAAGGRGCSAKEGDMDGCLAAASRPPGPWETATKRAGRDRELGNSHQLR